MKRTLSKKSIALILAIVLLTGLLFNNANTARRPSLLQHSAVISGDHAVLRVMPSRFTASIGVCWHGQRLTVWTPALFGFQRARCNGVDGWISRERITITDQERTHLYPV